MIPLTWLIAILLVAYILLIAGRLNLASVSQDLRRQEEAEAKGLRLLIDNLTAEQSQQYDRFGYFDVVGSKTGKRYRICHGGLLNLGTPRHHAQVGK